VKNKLAHQMTAERVAPTNAGSEKQYQQVLVYICSGKKLVKVLQSGEPP